MWLRNLEADRLRNLRAVSVELAAGLTLVTGRNGQGKTSVLEAIYLLGTGHSFRTRRLDEAIGWGGGPLRVGGRLSHLTGEVTLTVIAEGRERRLLADGIEQDLEGFLGRLDLVALPSDGTRVLRDAPEGRRRFLDGGIVGLRPAFLRDLGEYRRVLAERNALLRQIRGATDDRARELDVWEDRLAAAGARVHRARREYAMELGTGLGEIERALFPDEGPITLGYRPSPAPAADADPADFASVFREALRRGRRRDAAFGFTAEGPHRDDFHVELGEVDLRRYGSAGQVRAAMIALSFGKLGLLRDRRRETPLLLMDDFDSDLDEGRASALADFLHGGNFQGILATSKEGFVDGLGVPFRKVRMDGGAAREA